MTTADLLDKLKSIASVDVHGKRVLIRSDLNVPAANGEVTDATRIERFIPTLRDLTARGAKVIVMSHFGLAQGRARSAIFAAPGCEEARLLDGGDNRAVR